MRTNHENDGRSFEDSLKTIFRIYNQHGIAKLEKCEPPTRTVGSGKFRRVIYMANPFLDFNGCWTERGGRAMHVEAKSTKDGRLPAGGEGGFSSTQLESMRAWREAGAVAVLLWESKGDCRLFYHEMILAGLEERKSLRHEDGIQVPQGVGFLLFDFIKLLRLHEHHERKIL